ncbi:MAG: DoxX family protein [Pseudonocardiaceae bacterium]
MSAVARLGLAAVFLVSGALKAVDPAQTRVAVSAYQLLPPDLVGPVATVLPLVELALGTVLLAGAFTRWVALASAVLLLVLITAVAQAWARGLSIDCGCFGGGGAVAKGATHYPQELARDAGILLLALWLLVRPRTALSVDGWLRADPDGRWVPVQTPSR